MAKGMTQSVPYWGSYHQELRIKALSRPGPKGHHQHKGSTDSGRNQGWLKAEFMINKVLANRARQLQPHT